MSTDYRELIATASMEHSATNDAGEYDFFLSDADAVLATRVTDLCPDCKNDVPAPDPTCHHPNTPTIADLLRWGTNVATATITLVDPYDDTTSVQVKDDPLGNIWADDLLAALRGEGKETQP